MSPNKHRGGMDKKESDEIIKRKINANAFALESLAAFGRFRTGLPKEMSSEARMERINEWVTTALLVVNEQIEELDAYDRADIEYVSPIYEFVVNMSALSFLEIKFVLDETALVRMLAETCPTDTLRNAIKKRTQLLREAENPESPENNDGDLD
jgi:uncharacterized protein YfkK (UPF0435 family)